MLAADNRRCDGKASIRDQDRTRDVEPDIAVEEAEAQQVPMWVGSAVRQLWQYANGKLGPDSDFTRIVECIEDWAGIEVGGNR